jgi:hypothetical protein
MKTNIESRMAKSDFRVSDFGRGKSPAAKARHRRWIKRSARVKMDETHSLNGQLKSEKVLC